MNLGQTPLVVVFSTSYLPRIGGAEIAISELTKRIQGMRFLIITGRFSRTHPPREYYNHVEIRRVGFGTPLDTWLLPFLGFVIALWRIRYEPRVILWGVQISQGTIAAWFIKKCKRKIPFMVTLQEGDSEEHLSRGRFGLIDLFWKLILKNADSVTAISEHLVSRAARYGFRKKVFLIPNGVSEHFVSEAFERIGREELECEYQVVPSEALIISLSRLVHKNGIDSLIRALPFLTTPARLMLIGDGQERTRLKHLAMSLGIANRVLFIGSISHDEALRYLRMSDVFVRPSRSEGLGSSFLEAMGAGVPLVATAVGGITDFLEDRVTGIAVKPDNPRDIARGIDVLLTDDEVRKNIIENARNLVVKRYLWVDLARTMEGVFQRLVT